MEVSLLRALLHNISSFFTLSLRDNLKCEPVQKNYEKIEEILKLLKPVLDAIVNTEAAPDSQLGKEFEELGISIDESRDLFENWRPLASQVYLVLQAEQLTARIRTSIQEIFQVLKNSHQCLPAELSSSSLEHCIQKIKTVGRHQATTIIDEALKDQSVGPGPSPEKLVKISDCLGLKSNQEILIEAVALEKLKDNAEQAEKNAEAEYIDQLISLITRMHDRLVMLKQSESSTPVPIPPDFCCPLSLELMTDPVILASGQTYERAFIRQWLDLGLTVCPKTRQALSHTNLIPNFTVKQLIASWCEINNVKLPDPVKCTSENQPSFLSKHDSGPLRDPQLRSNRSTSPVPHPAASPSHPRLNPSGDELGLDVDRVSLEDGSSNSEEKGAHSNGQPSVLSNGIGSHEQLSGMHNRVSSDSNVINDPSLVQRISGDGNPVLHSPTDSDASGELTKEPRATPSVNSQREPEFPPRFISTRSRSQSIWRRPSERLIPRIVSSPAVEARPDLSGVEIRVKDLVNDLKSSSIETQREATHELRLLAKHNMDNRVIIANCGAIPLLVHLLHSSDPKAQENAVTALLNLSISDNNKIAIANAEAIEPLIHVLQAGSPEARENSAATLFSLSVIEENKVRIGRSGAIVPLVELLGNGTPRGKKDAATALFNLSIFHENKARIVQAGAVRHLVELMDPAAGMVDKAVAVLANLATIQEGRVAIAQAGGIPALVEVVELGSSRGKENAAAALLQLCSTSTRFCNMVLQEGAVPPLVALSQSGTPRAKEKAQTLLNLFRQQRHGNAGRG